MTKGRLSTRGRLALGGALAGVALLALSANPLFAHPGEGAVGVPTHAEMHAHMDAVHGAGFSDRMHAAMGANAEALMDQCLAMMGMMARMGGMYGGGVMGGSGMMGQGGMPGMMGGMPGMYGGGMMGHGGMMGQGGVPGGGMAGGGMMGRLPGR